MFLLALYCSNLLLQVLADLRGAHQKVPTLFKEIQPEVRDN